MKKIIFILFTTLLLGCHSQEYLMNRTINDVKGNREKLGQIVKYLIANNIPKIEVNKIENLDHKDALKKMGINSVNILIGKNYDNDSTVIFRKYKYSANTMSK